MEPIEIKNILSLIVRFAESNDNILALGLCGSWANGSAGPDSDIDLILVVRDQDGFRSKDWIDTIEFKEVDDELDHFMDKTYGNVWSRHVILKSGLEIEFSMAKESWANHENQDEGTVRVVKDGFRILYDPYLILGRLVDEILG